MSDNLLSKKDLPILLGLSLFPALLICDFVFITQFAREFLYPNQMIPLHLLLVLALISFVTIITVILSRLPTFIKVLPLLILILLLVSLFIGCLFSNRTWGDNITPNIILSFIFHDASSYQKISTALSGHLMYLPLMVLGISAISYFAILFVRALTDLNTKSVKLTYLLSPLFYLGICAPLSWNAVLSKTHPEWFRGEPILWALFQWPVILDIAGEDHFRKTALMEDDLSRRKYFNDIKVAPNKSVIIIMLDSLRADRLPIYGYQRPTTPFIDDLRKSGLLSKVDTALSACSESFCGIASTLSSHPYFKIGAGNFRLHEILKNEGFKNHFLLVGDHSDWAGLREFYGKEIDSWHDYKTTKNGMHDDSIILKGLEELPQHGDSPTFIFSFLMSTHVLGTRMDEFRKYRPDDMTNYIQLWSERSLSNFIDKLNGKITAQNALENVKNNYDNGVLQGDWIIRKIFEVLSKKGYMDDSIVIILGDHGDSQGEHDHVGHNLFLYQENIRIPLLVWTSKGRKIVNTEFAAQTDVAPTVLDFLNLPIPPTYDGHSLFSSKIPSYTVHQTRRGKRPCAAALERDSNNQYFKLIECIGIDGSREKKIYNLSVDPGETKDISVTVSKEITDSLNDKLFFFHSKVVNSCKSDDCTEG